MAKKKRLKIKQTKNGLIYRCHYLCGACGEGGKHYIYPNTPVVRCKTCSNKLEVEPATQQKDENGVPVPDKRGNYYTAHHVKRAVYA